MTSFVLHNSLESMWLKFRLQNLKRQRPKSPNILPKSLKLHRLPLSPRSYHQQTTSSQPRKNPLRFDQSKYQALSHSVLRGIPHRQQNQSLIQNPVGKNQRANNNRLNKVLQIGARNVLQESPKTAHRKPHWRNHLLDDHYRRLHQRRWSNHYRNSDRCLGRSELLPSQCRSQRESTGRTKPPRPFKQFDQLLQHR